MKSGLARPSLVGPWLGRGNHSEPSSAATVTSSGFLESANGTATEPATVEYSSQPFCTINSMMSPVGDADVRVVRYTHRLTNPSWLVSYTGPNEGSELHSQRKSLASSGCAPARAWLAFPISFFVDELPRVAMFRSVTYRS